jgi:hypothetical protein
MTFARLSIERKLTLIIVLTTAAALGLASSVLIVRHAHLARVKMIRDLETVAGIIGNNSQAALSFADASDAADVLASLRDMSAIRAACLYQPDGRILAEYRAPPLPATFAFPPPGAAGFQMAGDELLLFRQVLQDGNAVGTLYLNADLAPMRQTVARQILWAAVMTLASILLASLLASRLQRGIIGQIDRVVKMADAIAEGDLPPRLPVTTGDEIGALQNSFNQMVDTARDIVRQAQTLARGDYSITIRPRSGKDELSMALIQMTEALKSYHEQSEKLNWIKTGLSEVNDRMRGEQELPALLNNILSSLAGYLDGQVGALYLASGESRLRLAAGFALAADAAGKEYPVGEGVVGQAALERRLFVLSELPREELMIHSGLSQIRPAAIAVVPLVREREVVGVLALGKTSPFQPDQLELLKLGGESIAIAIHTAQARARLNELLNETQRQSQILKEQQAVLHKANADLEEHNVLLEKQKQEIHRKNTELEEARLDLERKAREIEQASQYKSDFLANVSHELRTPLNSLLILSRLLGENKEGNLTPKQIEFARTINKSGSDLLTLINDILDLSKVEAGKLEIAIDDVNLGETVSSLEGIFRPIADQKHLTFEIARDDGAPQRLRTDAHRLAQILRNLLSNAFKFTHQGSVGLRIVKAQAEEWPGGAPAVAFTVRDSGIGIPKEKQSVIFNAFEQADGTTSREYGGTGLGLAISRELARRLGGDITVTSEPGRGSAFTLYLPSAAAALPAPPAAVPPASAAQPARAMEDDRVRIRPGDRVLLVVEDDPRFAGIVMDFARARGFVCLAAANGQEGLRLADELQPSGIILDVMLPVLDGHEVLRRLKESPRTRHIPVHVISALDQDQQMMREGAVGFLTKPVSPAQLESALARIERILSRTRKTLLVVEDDEAEARSIANPIDHDRVRVEISHTGARALELLAREPFDCIVVDLGLGDMSGFTLLERIVQDKNGRYAPIIVHTGKDLTREEEGRLRRYAESVIIKGEHSPERLLEKVTLFLHVPPAGAAAAPAPEPGAASPAPTAARGAGGSLKNRRVLIVDDDMRNAYSLSAVLDQEGVVSDVAVDGRKALAKLAAQPDVDAILMDMTMPVMDGYEAIREIRKMERFRGTPIVALTARAMTGDREKCLAAGATDYLPKPLDVDRLLGKLQDLLER